MLPCRVAIYEKEDGKTYIAWSNYAQNSNLPGKQATNLFKEISKDLKEITKGVVAN
jgi:uncharacterized protein (DUF302 family)